MLNYTILQVNCLVLGGEVARYMLDAMGTKAVVMSPREKSGKWSAETEIGLRPPCL